MTADVQGMRRPYRCVEVALAVHGDVQPRLGALDGNDPEPHRNQVELHCKTKDTKKKKKKVIVLLLKLSGLSHPHPPYPPPPCALQSKSVKGEDVMCLEKKRERQGRISREGGMEPGCCYSRGRREKITGVTGWRIPVWERESKEGGRYGERLRRGSKLQSLLNSFPSVLIRKTALPYVSCFPGVEYWILHGHKPTYNLTSARPSVACTLLYRHLHCNQCHTCKMHSCTCCSTLCACNFQAASSSEHLQQDEIGQSVHGN